ncbi:MAG: TIGR00159 family protein [Ruminococcaceae bacterium]|nr:TIGR00159 family protein [Oscillospiraceae bacterium]
MGQILDYLKNLWEYVCDQFSSMGLVDFVDIALVSILLYYVLVFIRERRAGRLAIGVIFLLLAVMISNVLSMRSLGFILENVVQVGMVALIVIFQPELRSMLEKMGGSSIKGLTKLSENKENTEKTALIEEICEACANLSESRTGALIAIEGITKLGDEIKSGVVVNADVSRYLIGNIFFNKAPLHDGAMIIRDSRVYACGCFLPLSHNHEIIKELGTRHRAAIGLSEVSDAFVIVVSEETGMISVARDGKLTRNFDKHSLAEQLKLLYEVDAQKKENPVKKLYTLTKKKGGKNGER